MHDDEKTNHNIIGEISRLDLIRTEYNRIGERINYLLHKDTLSNARRLTVEEEGVAAAE